MKNKIIFFTTFLAIFLLGLTGTALAERSEALPNYIAQIYQVFIVSAGVIATISFAIGAVGFLISGASPDLASSSKDRMFGSLLGLIILLSSHLIMSQISPKLTNLTLEMPGAPTLETPNTVAAGVYFYKNPGCSDERETPLYTTSSIEDSQKLSDKKYVKIVNNNEADEFYGVIAHEQIELSYGGGCTDPLLADGGCQTIGLFLGSVDVFKLNKDPRSSGSGVVFYSGPWGARTEQKAGFNAIERINYPKTFTNAKNLTFNYEGTDRDPDYVNKYKTFQDSPGSIEMLGNYLVALYAKKNSQNINIPVLNTRSSALENNFCITFNSTNEKSKAFAKDLFTTPFTIYGQPRLVGDVYILPIKK
jgi:hypothetical protein